MRLYAVRRRWSSECIVILIVDWTDAAAHGAMVAFTRSEGDGEYAQRVAMAMLAEGGMAESEITLGVYDFDTDTFTTSGERYNAFQIRVDASQALRKELLIAPYAQWLN